MRNIDSAASRTWKIINPSSLNELGVPVGYKTLPQASPNLWFPENTPAGNRGGFARHNLWVTAYDEDEHYAGAGPFTNLHPGGAGLPSYVEQDRPIEDTGIVVWHTFGHPCAPSGGLAGDASRIRRVHLTGERVFDGNPALDLPPSSSACHGD